MSPTSSLRHGTTLQKWSHKHIIDSQQMWSWKIAPNATNGVAYSQTARIQDALFSGAAACADRAQSWINPSSGFQGWALRMHLRKGSALHRALRWCSTPADHLSATVNLPRAGSSFADSRPDNRLLKPFAGPLVARFWHKHRRWSQTWWRRRTFLSTCAVLGSS